MKLGLLVTDHAYSDALTNEKIVLCGPAYPPPYGGIRVHLKRVADKLEHQGNRVYHHDTLQEYRYRYFIVYLCKLAWRLLLLRPDRVYYHTLYLTNSAGELRLLVWLKRLLKYKLVVVDHHCLHLITRPASFRRTLNKFVPAIDQQVLIGNSTYQSYCDTNIDAAPLVSVERAFIPPLCSEDETTPSGFEQFCVQHTPIITVAITRLVFMDGRDLYGADTAIELVRELKKQFPTTGLICLIGGVDEPMYYTMLRSRIAAYGLDESIFLVHGVYSLWPILKKTDLLLRPTLADGASVSEDEAHFLGVAVVASDVCLRHPKTITYRSGSLDDCSIKVSEVFERGTKTPANVQRNLMHAQSTR